MTNQQRNMNCQIATEIVQYFLISLFGFVTRNLNIIKVWDASSIKWMGIKGSGRGNLVKASTSAYEYESFSVVLSRYWADKSKKITLVDADFYTEVLKSV